MKKTVTCLALSLLLLGGCAQPQQKNLDYIGSEQAKTVALREAGLNGASFSDVTLDTRNGLDYYTVIFTADGQSYEYDIDALTGTVIESKQPSTSTALPTADSSAAASIALPETISSATPNASAPTTPVALTEEDAKGKALAHAGLTAEEVSFLKTRLDNDHGRQTYDVEFYTKDGKEYDYEIDPQTGEVLSYDFDADSAIPPASGGSSITADRAKEIALAAVPGATAADMREFETDHDDGRLVYEGKIIYDGREYEFEIDGYSGAIRSWESEPIRR